MNFSGEIRLLTRTRKGLGSTGRCLRKVVLVSVVSLLIVNFGASQSQHEDRPTRPGPDEDPKYFPIEVFGSNRSQPAMWYSWFLRSMWERPWDECVSPECPQVYRLLIATRPYNAPVVVRLRVRTVGVSELIAKVGRDGGHPQILTLSRTTDPTRADVDEFLKHIDEAGFWSLPARVPIDLHHVPMGEASWMLEGIRDGRYHLVYRVASELGSLKSPLNLLVKSLGNLDLQTLPVGPNAPRK